MDKKGFSLNKKGLECVYVHDGGAYKSSNTQSFSTLLQTLPDSRGIVGKNSAYMVCWILLGSKLYVKKL